MADSDDGWFGIQRPYPFKFDNRKHPLCDHMLPGTLVVAPDGCSLQCEMCREIVVEVEPVAVVFESPE
jgi:hypothetical protein